VKRSVFLFLLLVSLVMTAGNAKTQDEILTFTHTERSLQPGEAVFFEIRSARPLKGLTVKAFDREFRAFTDDSGRNWKGLIGIDLETRPGRYHVRLNGIDTGGAAVAAMETLVVRDKKFPTRELTVDAKFVTPPAAVQARIQKESATVTAIFASISQERLWRGRFIVPVPGKVISAFGKRSVYNGKPRSPHTGTDFRGATGTPIKAPNTGRVVLAANLYYSGNTVILDHGMGLYSYMGHMVSFSVRKGDLVQRGDLIGKVGATGRVTGPHLHWTVRLAGSRIDPLSLIDVLRNRK
jgi:murein DD-endopeptidase MepM/ murein hydrolase activator NlpD